MAELEASRFIVVPTEAGRIDRVLAGRFPGASRRRMAELFDTGAVRIDGKRAKKGDRAPAGAEVTVARAPITDDDLVPVGDPAAAAALEVLYRDDAVVVVAKPAGMPSQPQRAGELGTAASGVVALFPECAQVASDRRDGGLVHRLDVGTSGALIAARTREAWLALRQSFSDGTIAKEYLALVAAQPVSSECEAPLSQRGGRVVVDYAGGLPAHTRWRVEQRGRDHVLVRCFATTGRMHQVRAHLATCGAPIVGDAQYGGPPGPGPGFYLHAARIDFPHPMTGARCVVEAPLPAAWAVALDGA